MHYFSAGVVSTARQNTWPGLFQVETISIKGAGSAQMVRRIMRNAGTTTTVKKKNKKTANHPIILEIMITLNQPPFGNF